MIVGIDLHNIRDGGGPNYIRNLLEAADPALDGFEHIHLFGASDVLRMFPDRRWITKQAIAELSKGLSARLGFVARRLPAALRAAECDILYAPGGVAFGNFRPYVTISRNMMPFRPNFWDMYPRFSAERLRLSILRRINAATFARANGMIYLSQTARDVIGPLLSRRPPAETIIPHGVDHDRFTAADHDALPATGKIEIVYPSRLEPYKHQIEVIEAIASLKRRHPGIRLTMCGPANPGYLSDVKQIVAASTEGAKEPWVRYIGEVPNAQLPNLYLRSDLLVFASSCENLPNILIEAMSAGIPACVSSCSPMPEIARGSCLYFDPTDPVSIAAAVSEALDDYSAALARARLGVELSRSYSWRETARRTFAFIGDVAAKANR